jgi:hypothetical protein
VMDIGNMTAANAFGERRGHATQIQRGAETSAQLRVLIVDPNPESRSELERLTRTCLT